MKLITFWYMPLQQKIIFCVNFMLCGLAKGLINLFPYQWISPYFGQHRRMQVYSTLVSQEQLHRALQIQRNIKLAVKYTPWDSSCLTQAMVAKFWCQYYNIPYMFYIGFEKNCSAPLGTIAHAWLMAGPIAVTGGNGFNTHHVVLSYSTRERKRSKDEYSK